MNIKFIHVAVLDVFSLGWIETHELDILSADTVTRPSSHGLISELIRQLPHV